MRISPNPTWSMAMRSTPSPKANPVYASGSYPTKRKTSGSIIPDPRISSHPLFLQTGQPCPLADDALDIHFRARFRKGKKAGAKTHLYIRAEELMDKIGQGPFQVREGDITIDDEPLDLVEHRAMGGVRIVPINPSRSDNPQRGFAASPWCAPGPARCGCARPRWA